MHSIVEFAFEAPQYILHITHKMWISKWNLRDGYLFRLQFISFRLSIFNEVISFSINHILYFQSNFLPVYFFFVCCSLFVFASLNPIKLFISLFGLCVWLSWFRSSARDLFAVFVQEFSISWYALIVNPIFENENLITIIIACNRCILDYSCIVIETPLTAKLSGIVFPPILTQPLIVSMFNTNFKSKDLAISFENFKQKYFVKFSKVVFKFLSEVFP